MLGTMVSPIPSHPSRLTDPHALSPRSTQALALYHEMGKTGAAPDIITYTNLIALLDRAGGASLDDSERVFREGVKAGVLMNPRLDSMFERDVSTLSYQLVRAAVHYSLQ